MVLSSEIIEDIIFIILFILFSIAIGMIIYRAFIGLGWVDSFYNSSLILSTLGQDAKVYTSLNKILVSLYALYSSIFFIVIISIIISRVISIQIGPNTYS